MCVRVCRLLRKKEPTDVYAHDLSLDLTGDTGAAGPPHLAAVTSDPAAVAANLRHYASLHDIARWRCLVRAYDLLDQAGIHASVLGRLRRDAQRYEWDAALNKQNHEGRT
jgi:hypothetical protein